LLPQILTGWMHSRAVPGLLAKIRIFSAPAEAERRLRIVYLSCLAAWSFCLFELCLFVLFWFVLFCFVLLLFGLFLFVLFLFESRNISSAGQLHEQTRMREEEARHTKF